MKNRNLWSLLFLLLFAACREDIKEITVTENTPDPNIIEAYEPIINNIEGSLIGFVVDRSQTPITDATIKIGNLTTTTDDYGHFFFNGITMNARGAVVQIEKEGYFDGGRRFFPKANHKNRVKIELIEKNFTQSFESTGGGTTTLDPGTSVQFGANSIAKADGTPYNGTVNVAMGSIIPFENFANFDQMPGNLQGLNTENEEVALGTFGMVAVELESPAGEPLNIAEGSTATLTVFVPEYLEASAPAEIPLWSYNTEHGIWVEESVAQLQNNTYVGEVSHFSFWNCDYPYELAEVEFVVENEDGLILTNHLVSIDLDGVGSGYSYTDENGAVSGLVPANEILTLNIHDYCGSIIYTQAIGPLSGVTNLGTITVTGALVNTTNVIGEFVNCDDIPIVNGLVTANINGYTVYEYTTGNPFDMTFTTCESITEVDVVGIDMDELVQSDPITVPTGTTTDVGTFAACDVAVENIITITVDGVSKTYFNASINVNVTGMNTYLESIGANQEYYVGLGFSGVTPGDYGLENNFLEVIYDNDQGWSLSPGLIAFENFDVDVFGEVGETVEGTFSGIMIDNVSGANVDVSGSFNITRQ